MPSSHVDGSRYLEPNTYTLRTPWYTATSPPETWGINCGTQGWSTLPYGRLAATGGKKPAGGDIQFPERYRTGTPALSKRLTKRAGCFLKYSDPHTI